MATTDNRTCLSCGSGVFPMVGVSWCSNIAADGTPQIYHTQCCPHCNNNEEYDEECSECGSTYCDGDCLYEEDDYYDDDDDDYYEDLPDDD